MPMGSDLDYVCLAVHFSELNDISNALYVSSSAQLLYIGWDKQILIEDAQITVWNGFSTDVYQYTHFVDRDFFISTPLGPSITTKNRRLIVYAVGQM